MADNYGRPITDGTYGQYRQPVQPAPEPAQPQFHEPEPEKKKNGWLIFTSILCIALIFTVAILAYTINIMKTQPPVNQLPGNVTQAFNEGVVASIIQLMKSTDQCQVASIKYFNVTRQIVDINCVRALLQQQNITLK